MRKKIIKYKRFLRYRELMRYNLLIKDYGSIKNYAISVINQTVKNCRPNKNGYGLQVNYDNIYKSVLKY